jgi:hypothetical protein
MTKVKLLRESQKTRYLRETKHTTLSTIVLSEMTDIHKTGLISWFEVFKTMGKIMGKNLVAECSALPILRGY